jgi:threonine/homoserine/homoserine lactone efflux protein
VNVPMLSFVAVSAVVIITPGPDTALTIRNTLRGGRPSGLRTGMGVALGQCVWAALTAVGIAGLVAASDLAFSVIKVIGVSYLTYLGLRALVAAWRGERGADEGAVVPAGSVDRSRSELRQGLYSNLGNPKMAAFFTSLLPQFAPNGSPIALFALGVLFASLTLVWLSVYAVVVTRFRASLEHGAVRRVLDAVLGVALVALAARLAGEQRA